MAYVWKEWLEHARGKSLWFALALWVPASVISFAHATAYPPEQGFPALLLALQGLNQYGVPLYGLFVASFSVMQEKDQRTLVMLRTKKESRASFLLRKSAAIHTVTIGLLIGWYFVLAVAMKAVFVFQLSAFLAFVGATAATLAMFSQIGILLGSVCRTRMQLVGANLLVWFAFLIGIDAVLLYVVPSVNDATIGAFSAAYFLDPLHTATWVIETAVGTVSLEHLSRLMQKMVRMPPAAYLFADLAFWLGGALALAVTGLREEGEHA